LISTRVWRSSSFSSRTRPRPTRQNPEDPITPDDSIDVERVQAEIAEEILEVHQQSYGTGAEEIQVHVADDLVVVIIDVELTPAERTLLTAGRGDAVKASREEFQAAIAPTFAAIAERSTGRRVISFLSAMNVEPPYAIEVFRLAPAD
jgi:uncharacterized protein YbcI